SNNTTIVIIALTMSSRGAAASRDQYSDSFLDDLISRFRRDVDRAFSDLWGDTNRSSTTGIRFGVWTPRVDGNVVVSGENKPDDTYNTGTAWTRERRFGRFMVNQ
ncbi:13518_t:CDS:2, partial [Racocetra fulgida]